MKTRPLRATWTIALLGSLAVAMLTGCGPRYSITTRAIPVPVGEATVDVVVHEADAPGLTYINLHDDENTSVEAARKILGAHGGRIVELRHTGARNVTFTLGDSTYAFDPNRIFTDDGISATLHRLGAYADTAHAAVAMFADTLRALFDLEHLPLVVTLHNNTEAQYSAASYAAGGEYAADARRVAMPNGADPDDFFFVTDASLFDRLRALGYVAVLQDNERATDDGSLSVYCGAHGLPYVNVEAQHGHRRRQTRMLDALRALVETPPV